MHKKNILYFIESLRLYFTYQDEANVTARPLSHDALLSLFSGVPIWEMLKMKRKKQKLRIY